MIIVPSRGSSFSSSWGLVSTASTTSLRPVIADKDGTSQLSKTDRQHHTTAERAGSHVASYNIRTCRRGYLWMTHKRRSLNRRRTTGE
jgi:hypothetical protein